MRRNKFSLSNYHMTTGNMGYAIPIYWKDILPGDRVQGRHIGFIRCAPLNAPPMHPVMVRFHTFFVRNRLLWNDDGGAETDFEAFVTGGSDGNKTPTHPHIDLNGVTVTQGTLHDYLGIPAATYPAVGYHCNALPFRAYAEIINNYYHDQDIDTQLTIDHSDGLDTTTNTTLQQVAWPKDPLNIVRPTDALGDNITIPFSGTSQIQGVGSDATTGWNTGPVNAYETGGSGAESYASYKDPTVAGDHFYFEEDPNNAGYPNITADYSASGIDIQDLLLSFGLQSMAEARNKYGHRYTDWQRYHGIRPSETLAYMPEYIGGGKQVMQFSEVLSTDGANTGDMKGHGLVALRSNQYRREFNEHGILMTIMSVVPKPVYCDGISKKWSKFTREEYFTKELQFIGDEIIENREIYNIHSSPFGTFGYGPRYEIDRYEPSQISGEFTPGSTEDHWHFGISYSGDPSLNPSFIKCTPPTDPFQSGATDQLYCMIQNQVVARRMISKEGRTKITL